MRDRTMLPGSVLVLALGLAGCSGPDSSPTPLSPSSLLPPALAPVYELTPTGRKPIARALVYCELCSKETHAFATADDEGFYQFSGDLAMGGGVWLTPGVPTPIIVGSYNPDFKDPPGLPATQGPGWRNALINGDTRFDIELVRRAAATP